MPIGLIHFGNYSLCVLEAFVRIHRNSNKVSPNFFCRTGITWIPAHWKHIHGGSIPVHERIKRAAGHGAVAKKSKIVEHLGHC